MVGLHDLYEFELVPDADGTISTEKWTQIEHALLHLQGKARWCSHFRNTPLRKPRLSWLRREGGPQCSVRRRANNGHRGFLLLSAVRRCDGPVFGRCGGVHALVFHCISGLNSGYPIWSARPGRQPSPLHLVERMPLLDEMGFKMAEADPLDEQGEDLAHAGSRA
jgi:hypothetical protein